MPSPPRRFVIPDIHGCSRTLSRLLTDVIRLEKRDELYLLGDYIDRGPRSKEVLDIIMKLKEEGYAVRPLRGNHEEMLLGASGDWSLFRLWVMNGGNATLDSFGAKSSTDIPAPYRRFIEALPYVIVLDDYVLVHASLNFQNPDPLADTMTMLWSRSTDIRKDLIGGRKVIGGHTPQKLDAIRKTLTTDRIMLDNGCVYTERKGMGRLVALELNSMTLYLQENIDKGEHP